ncbi:hypothetical protein HYALB_00003650 [Hymenoscyphus albidus]|uniref:N-acetyltransferase domain-containing protein n=1 Tax=Hymenoscyphus albidus TaxID=595503 RepID=A0A9N9Q195_9HELO|nr:hypothetical protein HYALB_00003650 [Hymenoscyphus albidus]
MDPPRSTYKLQHTPTGRPYIALQTHSPTPIFLTELLPRDAHTLVATMSLPAVNNALLSPPKDYTLASAEWWIAHQRSGKADLPLATLRAGDAESGGLIGGVSLGPGPRIGVKGSSALGEAGGDGGNGIDVELGYYLHPDWQGKGIIKPAARALIEWGRAEKGVNRVRVKVVEENMKSRANIESFGEFVRVNGEEEYLEWPLEKGGGRKKLLVFEWRI